MSGFLLDLRDKDVGGAVTSGRLFRIIEGGTEVEWDDRLADFSAATRLQRLLVLLHGYNNSRSVGCSRLVQYMSMLVAGGSKDLMVAVLWPGDGWAKALTYPFEGRDADDTAEALFKWLAAHVDPRARVAFVGHSLGCRVAMETAKLLARRRGRRGPVLDRICLMAPAIDNDCLGKTGKTCYQEATLAVERLAVLASEQDRVLQYAYPLGDLAQTIFFGERWGNALGRTGPIEHEASIVAKLEPLPKADPERTVDHGDYLDVDPSTRTKTIAESETFVLQFLARAGRPRWPAQAP